MPLPGVGVSDGAVLSRDGVYRYNLHRTWDLAKPPACFVMLNPSTADANVDDPTIRKCVGFARRWGLGGIEVVNLFAFRATDPRDLHAAARRGVDIVGCAPNFAGDPMNDDAIWNAVCRATKDANGNDAGGLVVAAWGAHGAQFPERVEEVAELLDEVGVSCLGLTANGQPRHPLMLAYDTPLQAWTHRSAP